MAQPGSSNSNHVLDEPPTPELMYRLTVESGDPGLISFMLFQNERNLVIENPQNFTNPWLEILKRVIAVKTDHPYFWARYITTNLGSARQKNQWEEKIMAKLTELEQSIIELKNKYSKAI